MIYKRVSIACGVGVLIAAAFVSTARCDEVETIQLTIHPAAAPRPVLKYRLLPDFKDQIRGNAAVYYGKVTAENTSTFGNQTRIEQIDRWRSTPLADLLKPDVEMHTTAIENMLRLAARCESCDWQLPIHEGPYYSMLLPEVQQLRQFARILAARARIQIAHGEFDQAIETLQSGFAIARNAAEGETIVNALVGIAIAGMMTDQVFELVQQPKAPNLYWALTTLPRPVVDMRKGIEAERIALELSFPEVRDLYAKRTAEQWQQTLASFWKGVVDALAENNSPSVDELVAESLVHVAAGRKALIDQGLDANTVDAMPNAQVALIDAVSTFEVDRDNLFRWYFMPYAEGLQANDAIKQEIEGEGEMNPWKRGEGPTTRGRLAHVLLPSLHAARRAEARSQRDIAVLRIVEALRLYGVGHQGKLPEKLADVTETPIPIDPMTGKAFEYRLNEGVATLSVTPFPGRPRTYEIRMVQQ